ncbi:MAG TPA: DUF6584 family protein [Natronosporangium sp.]|nr:DUF6584 family protein [Natronosporangium sp.]
MAKADVLARVKQDLALGHTFLATQRLRTLVAIEPDDLELRQMLASIYRQTGNLAESGRWAFLTGDATEAELAAFERANPDPWLRRRMLRWDGDPDTLPDHTVRRRLLALEAAARAAGPPDGYRAPARRQRAAGTAIPCLFVLIVLGGLGTLAAIGLVRIISWVVG